MISRSTPNDLAGKKIKEIFKNAEEIAELHGCLTSPRGDNFRLRLLQAMENPLEEAAIEQLKIQSGVNEYRRHLNRLLGFGLIRVEEIGGKKQCTRTSLGEKAINALREFERRVGEEASQAVYRASLGPNSIRFFLRVYGDKREASGADLQIRYTPAQLGRMSLFLPRAIEGFSAIDKLNEAGLTEYRDDNYIYMQPIKARSFYQYLQELYEITSANRETVKISAGRN
jgi:hypothetical protein